MILFDNPKLLQCFCLNNSCSAFHTGFLFKLKSFISQAEFTVSFIYFDSVLFESLCFQVQLTTEACVVRKKKMMNVKLKHWKIRKSLKHRKRFCVLHFRMLGKICLMKNLNRFSCHFLSSCYMKTTSSLDKPCLPELHRLGVHKTLNKICIGNFLLHRSVCLD